MKALISFCLVATILISAAAQDTYKPVLRQGVSVQMAVAPHALEMRAADDENSIVVAITADGRVFSGITPTEPGALSNLTAETVYVKSDFRAPFQKVLAVLDALRGKSVVLLTASPANAAKGGLVPPYGIRLPVSR